MYILQMEGFGELLEGLEPYSKRHLSRMNRLEPGTYLWDYTLGGLSFEPDYGGYRSIPPGQAEDSTVTEESGEGQKDNVAVSENNTSKKRKSKKLKNGSSKKTKAS